MGTCRSSLGCILAHFLHQLGVWTTQGLELTTGRAWGAPQASSSSTPTERDWEGKETLKLLCGVGREDAYSMTASGLFCRIPIFSDKLIKVTTFSTSSYGEH